MDSSGSQESKTFLTNDDGAVRSGSRARARAPTLHLSRSQVWQEQGGMESVKIMSAQFALFPFSAGCCGAAGSTSAVQTGLNSGQPLLTARSLPLPPPQPPLPPLLRHQSLQLSDRNKQPKAVFLFYSQLSSCQSSAVHTSPEH